MIITRKFIAANVGNILEWYDYILYGYLAPLFASSFFPARDHYAALLAAFASFAAGYITRPLGGIFFGYLGDIYGRGFAIRLCFPLMIFCTLLLGLMPTYQHIGLAAPVLITLIRLLQGFSTGGQSTGTYVYLSEEARVGQRGLQVGIGWSSLTLGILLGSLVCLAVFLWVPKNHAMLAWRIPYLLSVVFAIVWLPFRRYMQINQPEKQERVCFPLTTLFTQHFPTLIRAIIITSFPSVAYYTLLIFGITFLSSNGKLSLVQSMGITCIGLSLGIIITPFIGHATEKTGRKLMMLIGASGMLLLTLPFFHILLWGDYWLSLLCVMLLMVCKDLYAAPGITLVTEIFPKEVRYTGFALAWNIANGFFGGTAPLIALVLIHYFHNPIAPSYYLLLFSVLGLLAIINYKK
jgi:MHS family proline/betaine transporter-like MFS transporter